MEGSTSTERRSSVQTFWPLNRGRRITDFADSWKSGLGFNALIHYHRPDLIDFAKLDQRNKEYNLTNAFTVAEKHLGITPLLDPDDMSKPDEMSIYYNDLYFHILSGFQK